MVESSAAGYDVRVAGLDEVSARSVLAAMQDRLARDPFLALGLAVNATADEVRAAFLRLAKQYHPVRFGRMAHDIQKLANEVFLALRAAHDVLVRAALRQSGPIPTGRPSAPENARITQQLPVRPARALSSNDSGERPSVPMRAMTPPTGVKVTPAPVPTRAMTPPTGVKVTPAPVPTRAMTPPTGVKITPARPPGQQPITRPLSTVRQTGGHPVVTSPEEAIALDLLQRKQWDQARSMLHQLSAQDPSSKRIRALMCYARGREAQIDLRLDDARVELQAALELDPDLQLAKTALTELFTRRK